MKSYTEWLIKNDKSKNTIRRYLTVLNEFEKWLIKTDSSLNLNEVSALEIRDWKEFLIKEKTNKQGKRISTSTINNSLESLKTFYRFLHETGEVKENPVEYIKLQKEQNKRQPKWLNRNQKNNLLRFIEDSQEKEKNLWKYARNRAIISLMLLAGLRIGEITSLEIADINRGFILVREGKGNKSRLIPINKDLSDILNDWLKVRDTKDHIETPLLFTSQKGGPLTVSGINNLFERIRGKTQLSFLTPHVLRHTFGHDLAVKHTPIQVIAELMGHSDLETTRNYILAGEDEKRKAVELLSLNKFDD